MNDDRDPETIKKFPLRQLRLDLCECGHDDSDHQSEYSMTGVQDGACCLCVCKKFTLPMEQK